MKYMIHAAPPRMWYVDEFLVPSMRQQGIEDIEIRCDTDGKGNLMMCMESFEACGKLEGGTWHLQDDVIICRDFAVRTRENQSGIVCGFSCRNFGSVQERGSQPALFMWYSFQCIHIPNEIAGECAEWFFNDAMHRESQKVQDRKHDDWFFRKFIVERHRDDRVLNLKPNLVDHVDYLIGGTLINKKRQIRVNRAEFFEDQDLVDHLEAALKQR